VIEEFLKTGTIGELRLGLSQVEVRRILGEPKDYSAGSRKNQIWKYDSLEIAFATDSVCYLALDFSDGVLTLPEALVDEVRIANEKTSIADVEKLVEDIGLHSAVVEGLTFDDQRVMRIEESGVCIVCSENELICLQLSQ
jgi:hypothetical protein